MGSASAQRLRARVSQRYALASEYLDTCVLDLTRQRGSLLLQFLSWFILGQARKELVKYVDMFFAWCVLFVAAAAELLRKAFQLRANLAHAWAVCCLSKSWVAFVVMGHMV